MRKRISLAGQLLLSQVCIVIVVVVAVAGVSLVQSAASFRENEGRRLLSVAETVAANESVRLGLVSADAESVLASIAESARSVSGASSVTIVDRSGVLRTGEQSGQRMDLGEAPQRAWVGERDGQLVALVPVFNAAGVTVGVVVAARRYPTLGERFDAALPNLLTYLILGCVLGMAGSLLLARRVSRQTLGLGAHEIAGLAEHREAMLHAIREGVLALDPAGRVTLANDEAIRLLGLPPEPVGRALSSFGLSRKVRSVLTGQSSEPDVVVLHNDRVLVLNQVPVELRGNPSGSVTTLRDRTELVAMQHELDVTRYATDALHTQARSFAGRMGTILQLIDEGKFHDAAWHARQASRAYERLSRDIRRSIDDAGVAAMLVAKASQAAADGVDLQLARGSALPRLEGSVSVDVVAVLAAMVDHALVAFRPAGSGLLEVSVQFGASAVHLAVRESGPAHANTGRHDAFAIPAGPLTNGGPLAMARTICARRGGDVGWGHGDGSVLEAWLPAGVGAP